MSNGKVVELKLAEKKEPETLKQVIERYWETNKDDPDATMGHFLSAVLVVDTGIGLRVLPLRDATAYELIGMLEMGKATMVESLFMSAYDEDEE